MKSVKRTTEAYTGRSSLSFLADRACKNAAGWGFSDDPRDFYGAVRKVKITVIVEEITPVGKVRYNKKRAGE